LQSFTLEKTRDHLLELKIRRMKYKNSIRCFFTICKNFIKHSKEAKQINKLKKLKKFYSQFLRNLKKLAINKFKFLKEKYVVKIFISNAKRKITKTANKNMMLKNAATRRQINLKSKAFKTFGLFFKERLDEFKFLKEKHQQIVNSLKFFLIRKQFFSYITLAKLFK
jgi:hypothetical protein